jgi:nitroreductase
MDKDIQGGLQIIFGRRSIRVYRPGLIPDETIQTLLEAAMAAPSAVAKDPWRFIVVKEPTTLRHLAGFLPNGAMLGEAAAGIVVCGDIEAAHDRQISYLLQDCSAAIQNLLLAAHAQGLGSCWLGVHPREDRIQKISQFLGLPQAVIPVSVLALGWPGETKEGRTRYNSAWVHHERW